MAALSNEEVLANLKTQLVTTEETRLKLIGAIDVLQQIAESQTPAAATGTVEVVEQEGGE
jgi:hypothetical protein|tara:strand:- start:50 stop:229 length:180 start_codon:yes stop_codon:yes gene_type:complete